MSTITYSKEFELVSVLSIDQCENTTVYTPKKIDLKLWYAKIKKSMISQKSFIGILASIVLFLLGMMLLQYNIVHNVIQSGQTKKMELLMSKINEFEVNLTHSIRLELQNDNTKQTEITKILEQEINLMKNESEENFDDLEQKWSDLKFESKIFDDDLDVLESQVSNQTLRFDASLEDLEKEMYNNSREFEAKISEQINSLATNTEQRFKSVSEIVSDQELHLEAFKRKVQVDEEQIKSSIKINTGQLNSLDSRLTDMKTKHENRLNVIQSSLDKFKLESLPGPKEKTKSSASAGSSWNYKVSCWSGCGALKILVTTSSGDPELDVGTSKGSDDLCTKNNGGTSEECNINTNRSEVYVKIMAYNSLNNIHVKFNGTTVTSVTEV